MESPWHEFVDFIPDTVGVEIHASEVEDASNYPVYGADVKVEHVVDQIERKDGLYYVVKLRSREKDEISLADLLHLPGATEAIQEFERASPSFGSTGRSSRSSTMPVTLRPGQYKRKREPGYVDISTINISDDESTSSGKRPRLRLFVRNPSRSSSVSSDSESDLVRPRPRKSQRQEKESELADLSSENTTGSDGSNFIDSISRTRRFKKTSKHAVRKSNRTGRHRQRMLELGEDDIPERDLPVREAAQKFTAMKEHFPHLPVDDEFRARHLPFCFSCGNDKESQEFGPLVFCQGCTFAYHASCLGPRNGRQHLVTKVGKGNFVLQCRRCIEHAAKTDSVAPKHSRCQDCQVRGAATKLLRNRKTIREEQKEREENNGEDPITSVDLQKLNNKGTVLFRCIACERAWHLEHLPAREESIFETEDPERKAVERWDEYCQEWTCLDCLDVPGRIGTLIAWRPKIMDDFVVGMKPEAVPYDEKEFLVKWESKPYSASLWMPGAWIWKVASSTMIAAFYKRDDGNVPPISRTEDAIPEDHLRVDIVFKVEYNNVVTDHIEEVDLARVREVERALVKYEGLAHEHVVWDKPPDPVQEPERWKDFKDAYENWVRGQYIHLPASSTMGNNVRKVKALPFEEKVMLKEQPASLRGGELMAYQLEGLNWLYYQWHHGQNAILADEMGLGKTIQVISFLSVLQEKHHCWPFLIVVPNATVANWKREIKHWVPSLRVVTYFGAAKAMELTEKYELFHHDKRDLSCHVVVTSYEAAQTPSSLNVLRKVPWQAQIVDEGQRLKNDQNLLYGALSKLRAPFKLLMTGTPLQNNQRELFNLLQFLDAKIDARALEKKYETLTKENLAELHDLLRPFFLRRTKAQVLTFLPTMAQIIVPVTMTGLQKQLYKTILAKNSELLRSIFGGEGRAPAKGGLRNILMLLRKCLCHPFVYNREIEERGLPPLISHRRLVEASSKLRLLEIMLPRLQERGHRVLIFSQFLDMLTIMEDFLHDLGLEHSRLDGTMSSLEKQRCIDSFNAPNSAIFALLLSTRAGGVGINLATADTVIILDPDFNPHQDIQAISRAHRIGQKNKVLVFQLTTRMSAEEKIMQIGKKKMALDHALIDSMDGDEESVEDVEAVLRYGAEALFKNEESAEIHYDLESVEKLLDRSQIENTASDENNSAESHFSFARVWQNETASMAEGLAGLDHQVDSTGNVWDQIVAERARQVAEEAIKRAEKLGRGKRQRKEVDYHAEDGPAIASGETDDQDTDFQAQESEESAEDEGGENNEEIAKELKEDVANRPVRSKIISPLRPTFKRVEVRPVPTVPRPNARRCPACNKDHPVGSCPLKIAGPEYCGLCGLAHFSYQRTCPHLSSETQVQAMLQALNQSPESKEHVDKARKLLHGIKGSIVQQKKRKAEAAAQQSTASSNGVARTGNVVYHDPSGLAVYASAVQQPAVRQPGPVLGYFPHGAGHMGVWNGHGPAPWPAPQIYRHGMLPQPYPQQAMPPGHVMGYGQQPYGYVAHVNSHAPAKGPVQAAPVRPAAHGHQAANNTPMPDQGGDKL